MVMGGLLEKRKIFHGRVAIVLIICNLSDCKGREHR